MVQYNFELAIEKIIDSLNFFPPKSYLLQLLSKEFTFDEIVCNMDIIENHYTVLNDLINA